MRRFQVMDLPPLLLLLSIRHWDLDIDDARTVRTLRSEETFRVSGADAEL